MATRSARTPQQRDARELAGTPQADPYRGAMLDPFQARALPAPEAKAAPAPEPTAATGSVRPTVDRPARSAGGPAVQPWTPNVMPAPATIAGILDFLLSIALVLFGISLLALLSLQSNLGAPDRSFYQGTDSGSVVLALVDFALAGGCSVGAIMLLGGRVLGRVSCTVSGWAILFLSAFWYLRGQVDGYLPLVVALVAAAMLLLSYQRSVTRWLGVLLPAQPG